MNRRPMPLTPCEHVATALRGGCPEKVPFTVYTGMFPQCEAERRLRNRGLCLVAPIWSFRQQRPNVRQESVHFTDERGRSMVRIRYTTPYGDLTTLEEDVGFTLWCREHMFKTPEDYRRLLFLIRDTAIEPDYAAPAKATQRGNGDILVLGNLGLEPMQQLISSLYMDAEDFCIEWHDNRDELLRLYEALVDLRRRTYPVVAAGPGEFVNYGGNVVPEILGRERFRQYYIPNYNEAAEVLHAHGKRIGTHLDANNALILEDVAATELDYIEAFDPGMGVSVSEARRAWRGKALWLNWPSAWHLKPADEVRKATFKLIQEAAPCDGFVIGITEDVPEERWQGNLSAIMDGIDMAAERGLARRKAKDSGGAA